MDAANEHRLVEGARSLGIALAGEQVERLGRHLALLQEWNRRINLTAIVEEAQAVELHFLDSLAVAPLVRECKTLIDVGSGAGFPGAVLAIALPSLRVTCIDAVGKKVAFLQTLRRTVAPNLEALHVRDDKVGRSFDAAVSRATWEPAEWLAHGAPLVREGGLLVAMLTADAPRLEAPKDFGVVPPIEYWVGGARRRIEAFRRA